MNLGENLRNEVGIALPHVAEGIFQAGLECVPLRPEEIESQPKIALLPLAPRGMRVSSSP